MTDILGISAYYHDSAACLVRDGEIIAAAQEERFTRKKHDAGFPTQAVRYCLREGGIGVKDLRYIAFYDKPLLKFERLLETYLAYAPRGISSFLKSMPVWLNEKLFLKTMLQREFLTLGDGIEKAGPAGVPLRRAPRIARRLGVLSRRPSTRPPCCAWTAWASGRRRSAWLGEGQELTPLWEIPFPHSLGLLYSAFTYYTGFKVNSGEYKVMGLAPYGRPKYVQAIYDNLLDLKPDGTFRMNMEYFNYCTGLTMTNSRFDQLFDGPPREAETQADPARDGSGPLGPGGHRGSHAPSGPHAPPRDRQRQPLPGRRRRAELRGQRPDPARGTVPRAVDPAGRG